VALVDTSSRCLGVAVAGTRARFGFFASSISRPMLACDINNNASTGTQYPRVLEWIVHSPFDLMSVLPCFLVARSPFYHINATCSLHRCCWHINSDMVVLTGGIIYIFFPKTNFPLLRLPCCCPKSALELSKTHLYHLLHTKESRRNRKKHRPQMRCVVLLVFYYLVFVSCGGVG
jgi:hypothetical protein